MRIGERDFLRVRHRRVAVGTVAHDHQEVVALVKLERALSEVLVTCSLVDLLYARTIYIIYCKVQTSVDICSCLCSTCGGGSVRSLNGSGETGKGRLLYLEHADPQVAGHIARSLFVIDDYLLAGGECHHHE